MTGRPAVVAVDVVGFVAAVVVGVDEELELCAVVVVVEAVDTLVGCDAANDAGDVVSDDICDGVLPVCGVADVPAALVEETVSFGSDASGEITPSSEPIR